MVNMKRRDKDITKLLMSNYDVIIVNEAKMNELYVILKGPQDSPYEEVINYILFNCLYIYLGLLESFS